MYVVGSRVLVSRFGVSSSLDQSNNANNYLAGQEILTTYNGFAGGVTSSYTGQHLGLSITNTIANGNIGDLYGVRVQNNIGNFTTYTGSTTNNYYGIRLQASIGTTSAAITTSIQNYYAAHISSLSIGATGRVTNLYGVYAEDSRMTHFFNGNVGIKTNRPAYEIDVVGSSRTQTISNFGILANPTGTPTATPLITGGALADGTYYYSITAIDNYFAQTTGSAITSASISGGGGAGSVQLSWTAVTGASYYIIYRGTTLGTYGTSYLSSQVTTTFTDVGGASAGYGFPNNNNTAITRIDNNGGLNVGNGVITFGNATGFPLRTLEIRRATGFAVQTGITIGSANTSFSSAYPNNTALPFVFGEFNTLTGSRYYVIGDNNNISPTISTNVLASLFIGYNNTYLGGINVTAIGRQNTINTSQVDNGCSITIGRGNSLNHRSIVIGTQVESTADGQLIIGQNNISENLTIRDIYFGNGIRNKFTTVDSNFGNGVNVTINGSGPTASADLAGGSLILAGGKGTGTGTPGDLIFSTSTRLASGVTLQSLSQRVWVKGDTGNVGIGTSSPTLANLQVQGNIWALSYTGSLFGTASYAPNIYNSNGTTTGTRTVTLGSNTLYFNSTRATGSAVEIVLNQTQPNSTDTNDIALVADYNITANSATNQLVVRPFVLKARNTLTGGGAVQNLRAFNLASYFNSSTTTTNADLIYLENGTGAGTVTNYRGLRIANFYGTNRAGVAMAPIGGGTNGSYILIGTDVIPSGFWGVYQSENTYNNYFAGNVGIGTTSPTLANLQVQGNVWALSYTGSLFGTSSWSQNAVTASNILGGSTNYIPIWTGTNTLSSSALYQSASSIGLNTVSPSASFHIIGNTDTGSLIFYTEASGGLPSFRVYNSARGVSNPGLLTSSFNEIFGSSALRSSSFSNPALTRNVAIGASALRVGSTIRTSIAIGTATMQEASGSITGSIAIGDSALGRQLGGAFNIAIGVNAMLGVSSTQANTGDRNVSIGGSSLQANTTGTGNSVLGDSVLPANSVGSYNTGTGFRSLRLNTSGSYNSAVGLDSFFNNTTASYGTAIGTQALYDSLTGDRNIALGFNAGRGITSGRANTIIGSVTGLSAGLSNNIILADGDGNIKYRWDGIQNTIYGNLDVSGSLRVTSSVFLSGVTTSPQSNVVTIDTATGQLYYTASSAIGGGGGGSLSGGATDYVARWASSTTLTTGSIFDNGTNVGIGTITPTQKLQVDGDAVIRTTYIGNIPAFGTNYASISHVSRTGSGDYSFLSDNTGITYINAKVSNPILFRIDNIDVVKIDSTGNVGINTITPTLAKLQVQGNVWAESYTGSLFGTASYAISSSYSISSSYTISSSYSISSSFAVSASWAPNTGGSSQWTSSGVNIYFNVGNVGVGTNSPAYPFDVSGNTRLANSLGVGTVAPSGTTGRIDASNDIVAFSSSDIRFKTNLKTISNPLDKISKVSGYEFDWIPDQENHGHEGHDIGVIAQEVEKILPEIVTTRESGYKAVKYEKIVPLLIEAIKEQQKQIEELRYLLQNK